MPLAAKEERLSPSSDPCVFFPLAAFEGVDENSRLGFTRKNLAPHPGSAWSNSASALGIEEVLLESRVGCRSSGNTSGGFFHNLGNRLACAAEFGDAHSLAAATGTQNNFLGKAFLGNTFSGLTQLGLLVAGGPSSATTMDVGTAVLSGTHQGLPGGGNIGKGPLGVAQDAAVAGVATAGYNAVVGAGTQTLELGVNASGKVATAIGGLSETAAGTVAGIVGGVKLGADLLTFAYGGIFKCK